MGQLNKGREIVRKSQVPTKHLFDICWLMRGTLRRFDVANYPLKLFISSHLVSSMCAQAGPKSLLLALQVHFEKRDLTNSTQCDHISYPLPGWAAATLYHACHCSQISNYLLMWLSRKSGVGSRIPEPIVWSFILSLLCCLLSIFQASIYPVRAYHELIIG